MSFPAMAESSKILCELDGTYSVTYKDIKKTYLSEGIELFKNLARQTQQSLFLLQRAKTNFAEEDWQKDKMYVVQYWDVDTRKESFKSLKHTLDPSPAWINSNADWESTKTDTGITVTHTMNTGDVIHYFLIMRSIFIVFLIHSTGLLVKDKYLEIYGLTRKMAQRIETQRLR